MLHTEQGRFKKVPVTLQMTAVNLLYKKLDQKIGNVQGLK